MSNENENNIICQLLAEVETIPEDNFDAWYEKKRKLFNVGAKRKPTKQEFIKYLNYASAIFPNEKICNS
jgi:hypothetical protein